MSSCRATNTLVYEYLQVHYPSVAAVFEREAPVDRLSRKRQYANRSLEDLIAGHIKPTPDSSSDDDEPFRKVAKTSPKAAPKKAPIPDSSSDDDEPVRKPVAKTSPKAAPKKAPIPDSSSDDDEPVRKPVAKTSPKAAPKKAPIPDSSSDDDEEAVRRPVGGKAVRSEEDPTAVPSKSRRVESSDDVEERNNRMQRTEKNRGPQRNPDGSFRRFQRIDPEKVKFTHEALKDNRPGEEHLVLRQNQEMMRVKGKQFNKLKQKNKGKFYGAGVDTTVRAYQFPDSDSD